MTASRKLATALAALLSTASIVRGDVSLESVMSSVGEEPVWNSSTPSFYGDTEVVGSIWNLPGDDAILNITRSPGYGHEDFPNTTRTSFDYELANASHPFPDFGISKLTKRQSKVPLRILTLGASTARGVGSSDELGFRKHIRDAFRSEGHAVNMVGSKNFGSGMKDNDHEAEPGAVLSEIRNYLKSSLGTLANIVLIQGGTNNARGSNGVTTAGTAMWEIMWDIWNAPGMSNTCIFVSTLLWTDHHPGETNRLAMNDQYRAVVAEASRSPYNKCVYVADMDPPANSPGNNWINPSLVFDGIHPNDEGFRRMAWVYYSRMKQALADGRISAPAGDIQQGAPAGCDKKYSNGIYAGGLTQRGSGLDDGEYAHASSPMGTLLEVESGWDRNQWRFARLYSRDRDDFVGWFEPSPGVHAFGTWKNFGNGDFRKVADLNPDLFCIPRGLHFIDMNADGLDDIVCIDQDGNAYLSINLGDGNDSRPPTFKRVSGDAKIMNSKGWPQSRVRMADIDGDGRGDYCILNDGGHVECWRNGWVDDIPKYWQSLGRVFDAKGMGDVNGVRFEDINGDGRDDWLWVGDEGRVHTWTNSRTCAQGRLANWQEHRNGHSTPTHAGMGGTGKRDRIHFARIYGEPQDYGLLGRQDYVYLEHEELSSDRHRFRMRVWKNNGSGGTKVKMDGNKYCNMMGHPDGRMDYVWVHSKGEMTMYPNAGRDTVSNGGPSFWGPSEVIWWPNRNYDRRDLHLADYNNDGYCDIIYVDPSNNNRMTVWINQRKSGSWNWDLWENQASHVQCSERRGIGYTDLAVRFADISGNGLADYLCLEENGRVTGFIHNSPGSFGSREQIKFSETMDRANLRWADVNGDGSDDMLWIDKFSGDASVWYNGGRGDPSDLGGSSFFWRRISSPVYNGNRAGTCMFHPDLDGNGRADMHAVEGTWTNKAETWFNPDCGFTDETGDDGTPTFPDLPVQPGDPGWGQGGGGGGGGGAEPIEQPWLGISCDHGHLGDDLAPSYYRWEDAKAAEAWEAALDEWESYKNTNPEGFQFSEVISNFFDGTSNRLCANVPNQQCDTTIPCDQSTGDGARGVDSPAGYMIINSFAHLHSPMSDLDGAIKAAQNSLQGTTSDIVKAFTSISKNSETKIALDVMQLIIGLSLMPFWNSWIKKVPNYDDYANFVSSAKETMATFLTFGIAYSKDIMTTVPDNAMSLQSLATNICFALRATNVQMARLLFDGGDTRLINTMMLTGIAHSTRGIDPYDVEQSLYRALVATSIPPMWMTEKPTGFLWIMNADGIPQDGTGCDGLDPSTITFSAGFGRRTFVCVDGNKPFWLMMVGRLCVGNGGTRTCDRDFYDTPYGHENINGVNFGGLTKEDLIKSALNSKAKNGGKNGWSVADVEKVETLNALAENGVHAPGIFNVPICSRDEMIENFRLDGRPKNLETWPGFPCNKS